MNGKESERQTLTVSIDNSEFKDFIQTILIADILGISQLAVNKALNPKKEQGIR